MQDNEQWLLDGDCSKCRKNNYCSKPCTRHKRMINFRIKSLIFHTINDMSNGVFNEILKNK